MFLSVVTVYILSLIVLFFILFKFKDPLYAVIVSTFFFGVIAYFGKGNLFMTDVYKGIFGPQSIRVYILIFLAFYLAQLLKDVKILDNLTKGFSSISTRLAAIFIPSAIGLIPLPGGALVSAISVKDLYFKVLRIKKDFATYVNFWFRHIWVPSWPLFQSIILTAAILNIGIYTVVGTTFLGTVAVLTLVPLVLYFLPKVDGGEKDYLSLFKGIWIFLLIAALVIMVKLPLEYVLLASIILVSLIYRVGLDLHRKAFGFAFKPKIFGIIAFSFVFKEFILTSGADKEFLELVSQYNINPYMITFLLPFIMGLASSSEYIFVITSFPILYKFIIVNGVLQRMMLLVGYIAGWLGALLSPLHLCLILTADYYETPLSSAYKYLIPSFLYTLTVVYSLGAFLYLL
jgi:hypothetical protein